MVMMRHACFRRWERRNGAKAASAGIDRNANTVEATRSQFPIWTVPRTQAGQHEGHGGVDGTSNQPNGALEKAIPTTQLRNEMHSMRVNQ